MPKITRYPFFGKRFFRLARKLVGSCQFQHLWRMVVAIAGMHGRRSLSRIVALTNQERTRQALSHFLTQAEWDAPEVLWRTALSTLAQLGFRPGDPLYLVLDDTQKRKRGKLMAAVSKIFLHAEKVYANGHTILGAALIYRNVVIPCAVRLWASEARCAEGLEAEPGVPLKFRKLTHLAADLIGDWWTRLVMREAFFGRRRFEEFQSPLDVPRAVLTARASRMASPRTPRDKALVSLASTRRWTWSS